MKRLCVAAAALSLSATALAGPQARGLTERTALIHLHSPYSHDACDDEGLDADGAPNAECLSRLRQAMCDTHRSFFLLTDHPAHMTEQPFERTFLYDPALGDELLPDDAGGVLANQILCIEGDTAWNAWILVGYENANAMPVGLTAHVPSGVPGVGYGTDVDLASQQEAIAQVHEVGGITMLAHAEEDDITPQRIIDMGLDTLELYNAHANINVILYQHPLQLLDLETWVEGAQDAPVSDYVALMAYRYMDLRPLDKWNEILWQRPLPGGIGTDVHENVILDAYCSMPPFRRLCDTLAVFYPNLVAWLREGGPIPMADGERLDSYDRMFRWFSNHLLLRGEGPEALKQALRDGNGYVAFDILANPSGFDFYGSDAAGAAVEMGETTAWSPGLSLNIEVARPAPLDVRGQLWSQADLDRARITGRVLWSSAEGVRRVLDLDERDTGASFHPPGPGAYRVELDIQPLHLSAVLGSQSQYAGFTYPWLWSGPIYVR